jgi:HEAT repeat protein
VSKKSAHEIKTNIRPLNQNYETQSQGSPHLSKLIEALKGKDSELHESAIKALRKIHSDPDVVIPLLVTYLDDENINDEAATALGNFGSLAKGAIPKIVPLLRAPDDDAQAAAREALEKSILLPPHRRKPTRKMTCGRKRRKILQQICPMLREKRVRSKIESAINLRSCQQCGGNFKTLPDSKGFIRANSLNKPKY